MSYAATGQADVKTVATAAAAGASLFVWAALGVGAFVWLWWMTHVDEDKQVQAFSRYLQARR